MAKIYERKGTTNIMNHIVGPFWRQMAQAEFPEAPEAPESPDEVAMKSHRFETMKALRDAFSDFCFRHQLAFIVADSRPTRYEAKCPGPCREGAKACQFFIIANRSRGIVRVTSSILRHSIFCAAVARARTHNVEMMAIPALADRGHILSQDLIHQIRRETGIKSRYYAVWKSIRQASLRGVDAKSYTLIRPYLEAIQRANPGTLYAIEQSESGSIDQVFFCLQQCQLALSNSKSVIMLDACHMKTIQKGILFTACTEDGDGQIVPLAFFFSNFTESEATWTYFLQALRASIPDSARPYVAFIIDADKGLKQALAAVYPECYAASCVFHLYNNVIKHCPRSINRQMLFNIGKCTTLQQFRTHIEHLSLQFPRVHAYLTSRGYETFVLALAPGRRFGILTSNNSESLNAKMESIRGQSVFQALVSIVDWIGTLFFERRTFYSQRETYLSLRSQTRLMQNSNKGSKWRVIQYSQVIFRCKLGDSSVVVNLSETTCTCGEYQEYSFPCIHAASIIIQGNLDLSEFIHHAYTTEDLKLLYGPTIIPVDITSLQPDTDAKAPTPQKQSGRPKLQRLRSRNEIRVSMLTCSVCHLQGHNARTCAARHRQQETPIAIHPQGWSPVVYVLNNDA